MLEEVIIVLVIYGKSLVLNQLSDAYRCCVSPTEVRTVFDEHMLQVNLVEALHRVEV